MISHPIYAGAYILAYIYNHVSHSLANVSGDLARVQVRVLAEPLFCAPFWPAFEGNASMIGSRSGSIAELAGLPARWTAPENA